MRSDPAVLSQPQPEPAAALGGEAITSYKLGDNFAQQQYASIMMVDDEPLTMEVVQTFLEDAGYRKFHLVDDSTQAMRELHEQRPDVLLLDVMMPAVSGFDILKMLRQEPDFAHLPVIILTSSADAETKLTALDLGATDFLSKPVDPSELALRVRNTLAAKAYQDQLAYYDVLTNLPNIQLFRVRTDWAIQRARREQRKVVLMRISFNDFERINDALGPEVGDEVLKQLAQRLTQHVRASDAVSRDTAEGNLWADVFRVDGADFSVLLPALDNIASAAPIGQRIFDAMRQPLQALGHTIYLTPSIGVAGFPDDAPDTTTLIKCAMSASVQAGEQGAGHLQFYSAEMNAASIRRYRLEAELRNAIKNEDFKLLYQPKVSVGSGAIIGAEALIRWQQVDGTVISPLDFIPIAEETGLIIPIGEWVLREACVQIARWHAAGFKLKVAVNISAQQLFEADLVAQVYAAVAAAEIDPRYLMLEMTESQLIEDVERAVHTMSRLRKYGVAISMDDFGTGYSSLSYLKQFPLDEVKIDRSFLIDVVSSEQDQALVTVITYLAHKFDFQVCAEGVEALDQLQVLKKVRCDIYQGYYFSRPIEAETFTEKLQGSPDKLFAIG